MSVGIDVCAYLHAPARAAAAVVAVPPPHPYRHARSVLLQTETIYTIYTKAPTSMKPQL